MKPKIIQEREDLDLELFRTKVGEVLTENDYTEELAEIRAALVDIDKRITILQEDPCIYLDKNRMTIGTELQREHNQNRRWKIEHLTEKEFFKRRLAGK